MVTMKRVRVPTPALAVALALAVGACAPEAGPANGAAPLETPATVVDSVLPMQVMLDRFRADVPEPRSLRGATDTRDELVARVVRALEQADTAAFVEMAVSLPEWAWLYYPSSLQARPPYELPPGMAWLAVQNNNRTGVLRALERFGGRPLTYGGYTCTEEPTVEGENNVWVGCLVTIGRQGEEPMPIRLFSAILERDGRFAILSYANDF
jgi:hypothetical protein